MLELLEIIFPSLRWVRWIVGINAFLYQHPAFLMLEALEFVNPFRLPVMLGGDFQAQQPTSNVPTPTVGLDVDISDNCNPAPNWSNYSTSLRHGM